MYDDSDHLRDDLPVVTDDAFRELSRCAAFHSRRLARAITIHFDRALDPIGLRITQAALLVSIGRQGSLTVSQLSAQHGLDHSTLVRNIARLREMGLVASVPGDDRRTRSLSLTEEGRQKVRSVIPLWREAQQVFVDAFGHDGWQENVERLERIRKLVDTEEPG